MLTDSSSKPEIWGAAIIVGHYRMAEIIDGNDGPFYASVGKRSDGHIERPKLPSGYELPQPMTVTESGPVLELTAPEPPK
jgi:hypothetical protein